MRNQKQVNNKLKKSQILLLGSLLVFVGVCVLSYEYIIKMKDAVFADMEIKLGENLVVPEEGDDVQEVPITNNLPEDTKTEEKPQQVIDYSKYLGVLEIPKIGLKRGFYNIDSRYNNIQYNVALVEGSSMPDVSNGNLILMAHSGWAAISYFEYLYNLSIGDYAYVTYAGKQYAYKLVNVYDVAKTGKVKIVRNYEKTNLTLITCTRNNDKAQTVYILELV
jgi:LPXTG-site transpeptidase (sortase) family protein